MNTTTRALIAEFLGTFTLVFLGGIAVASGQGVVVAAFAHGLVIVHAAYSYGHISGAHLNPAVTLGLLLGGKIEPVRALLYMLVQLGAGIVAALVAQALVGSTGQTTGSLTAGSVWTAAAFEAILTFILVSAVFQAAAFGKAGSFAGLAIGFTLAACILAGGTYTGASLNPARTLGPALVGGDLSYLVPYLIGTLGGAAIGGLVQTYIVGSKDG